VALALRSMTLEPGFSAAGYVYYPPGDYQTLEILWSIRRATSRR
jgi:hypothetical protein